MVKAKNNAAKTIKVDWREQKTLASGGSLKFRVTKIVATMRSWAVTARITNASPASVGIEPKGQAFAFPTPHPWWQSGMALLDVQWCTEHLASLGAVAIPRGEYLTRLADAVRPPSSLRTSDLIRWPRQE